MRFYFQYDNSGAVASYSQSELEVGKLNQVSLDVPSSDYELMKQNYILRIEDGKLVIKKPDHIKKQEETDLLKQEIENITPLTDIRPILLKLLNDK